MEARRFHWLRSKNNMSAKKLYARSALAGLAIAAISVPAMAADVVYQEPPAPAPQPIISTPVSDWSGPYVGLSAGYGFNGRVSDSAGTIDTDGFVGGAFGGFQMQNGMFVYGVEGDVNYSDVRGGGDLATPGVAARSTIDGSIRARAGVAVTNDVLVYGTAGGAAERQRLTDSVGNRDTNVMLGYTVGAGVDAKLTDQVFGRVEYRYTDYGSKDFDLGGTTINADSSNHRVTAGIGIKF
jgi:outer membrane immunogenic protein